MKDSFERYIILFVLILFFSMSIAVIKTAYNMERGMKEITERRHVPTECQQYYDNGTDEWKDCIGVGYQ